MITVITGTPGNGKTALAIDLVWFQDGIWKGLDCYVNGISDFKLPHFSFPPISELKRADYQVLARLDTEVAASDDDTELVLATPDDYAVWLRTSPHYTQFIQAREAAVSSFELWYLWVTPGSVIVVDEAQRFLRPRPAGARVPLYIQLLEYHRHFGVHFVFITQKERLLDTNVRMLAGQHIHITSNWRGRFLYEWSEVKDSDSKVEKQTAASKKYTLPKHVFGQYTSAIQHLQTKQKIPMFFYAMIAGFVIGLAILVYAITNFSTMFGAPAKKPPPSSVPASSVPASPSMSASGVPVISYASGVDAASVAAMAAAEQNFTPLTPGRPETAPAYAALRKVSIVPRAASCLQNSFKCYCYTQQGTRIDMSKELCEQTLKAGFPFDPYGDSVADNSVQSAPAPWSRTEQLKPDSQLTQQDKSAIADYKSSKVSP